MNKRILALVFFLLPLTVAVPLPAQQYEEELHYFSIIPEQPGAEGDRVQVIEFFWYACPHCYQLEPHLEAWLEKRPDNIDFDRVPAMFSRADVVLHAKTYYALRLMGLDAEMNDVIFRAIHDQGQQLKTQPEMEKLLQQNGVDLAAYRKAMKSFAVETQARRAAVLAERFDVRGVPAIVVDGKYRTSGLESSMTMDVTDYLIRRAQQEKSGTAK